MTSVRLAAARVLLALDNGQTTLGAEVARVRDGLEPRDQGLLVELTAGTLRWRNALDALIAAASRRAVREIDLRALAVLRLGAYQLRYLTRIPQHAIVHESVETMRELRAGKISGFVNAVLRALIRRGPTLALPKRTAADAHVDARVSYLSVTLSHPAWLVRRWLDRMPFDTVEAWCQFNNMAPPITVRSLGRQPIEALLAQLHEAGIEASPAPYVADAIRLPPGALGRVSSALRDQMAVQDEGAQLVARLVDARPGERVLDACAAPGGKTLVLAADMQLTGGGTGLLVAADIRPSRVALLADTIGRAALPVPVVQFDASRGLPFHDAFDAVLVDAPCSGLGTLRRDPDLKWTRAAADISALAADELTILIEAADAVRPGGRLIYATCSSEPDENGAVVDAFLERRPEFRDATITATPVPDVLRDARGRLVTDPPRHGLDAFFAAVLERRQAT